MAARPESCALVTGASRGIGRAIAQRLAGDGWAVAVNYSSDAEGAERTVAAIEAAGGSALAVQGDVGRSDDVEAMFALVEERLGPVLGLVNNAGVRADDLAVNLTDEMWSSVLAVNLEGTFKTIRRALRPMIRARWGRIVNVAAVAGIRASPGQTSYSASKGGVIAMSRTLAYEVARRGVTVNVVAPGLVETAMTAGISPKLMDYIPQRRAGLAEEIAAGVGFLASADASYVTGAVVPIDGGLSL